MQDAPDISVVIPVYNEKDSLPTLVDEIGLALCGRSYEVLFVDDGSTDGSLDVLRRLRAEQPRLRVLRLARNNGQSAALAAGFRAARAPVVVTLDADLQNDPADIPLLLERLENCDMVSGVRVDRHDSWPRRAASWIGNRVRSRVLGDGVTDVGCSLKAYRRDVLRLVPVWNGMHRFLPALIKIHGARIEEVAVSHRPRVHGESKYTIRGRMWRSFADLAGVRWLQSRAVDQEVEEL